LFRIFVGCGLWGRNLVRNFYNLESLACVCDLDQGNIDAIKDNYPNVKFTNDFNSLLADKEIDALIIATPSHTHYKMVKAALDADKHVYVEKPIATTADHAKEMKEYAEQKGKVLMVGHLLLYHPAVTRLRELVKEGVLGDVLYAQSDRLNINYFKNDKSVMWDLAPHDISMISYVTDKKPLKVDSAEGFCSDKTGIMDIVHIDMELEDGVKAHVSTSWIHPQKRVLLLVRGTKATALLDDTLPENKIQIFSNFAPGKQDVDYPDYLEIEPLKLECQHFLGCIENGLTPRSDGTNGYDVVKMLEDADKIMLGSDYERLNEYNFVSSRQTLLK
ncbi:MAG: Gfo/Idh/MocA family oxidoreductase, partial [Candidatus Gastranaerophilales bacterium]|nr:Gfo/Idh/MocA family oxidoreductase [Candidatus Gastranaerophilales bacterium]